MISSQTLGERIASVRKAKKLTQAKVASQLDVARTTLVAMEKGERRPSSEELLRLAKVLAVPMHDLVRERLARPQSAPRFRVSPSTAIDQQALRQAVERLTVLSQCFAELEATLGIGRPAAPLELLTMYQVAGSLQSGEPRLAGESAASRVRSTLGLGDSPALMLDDLFEVEGGLRIFYLDEIPSSVAGVFIWGDLLGGCIGINRKHPHERRRWTLAHEVGHFLRDREAGDILPTAGHARRDASEVFSDAFTEAFLLPHASVAKQLSDRCRTNAGSFSVADILWMAALYEVSFQAMALRLEKLDLLPRGTYERITAQKFKPEDARRKLGIATSAERPLPNPLPKRYVSLAIDAYEEELISERELAEYLQIDRVSARKVYQQSRWQDLGDGFGVELNLAERILSPA